MFLQPLHVLLTGLKLKATMYLLNILTSGNVTLNFYTFLFFLSLNPSFSRGDFSISRVYPNVSTIQQLVSLHKTALSLQAAGA